MLVSNSNSIFYKWKIANKYMFRNLSTSEKLYNYNNIRGSSITYHIILNEFHLNLVYNLKTKMNNRKEVASIDPGLRKFVTIYSPSKIIDIGKGSENKLLKICKEIDIIKSRMDRNN